MLLKDLNKTIHLRRLEKEKEERTPYVWLDCSIVHINKTSYIVMIDGKSCAIPKTQVAVPQKKLKQRGDARLLIRYSFFKSIMRAHDSKT